MSSYTAENNQVPQMQQNLELLKDVYLFSKFPSKALKLLSFIAERAQFFPGDIIFEEGDDYGRAYLILSGNLVLLKKQDDQELIVQDYGKGDFLGSFSLLDAMPALFTLQATTETTILTINRNQFLKILEQFPETTTLAVKALLKGLHQWERKNIHQAGACCLSRAGATVL